jgi:5-formyltetrahydrofolate cyclo-ligase
LKALEPKTEPELSSKAGLLGRRLLDDLPVGILLTYVPIRGEIDPITLLTFAIAKDWAVAAPCCTTKDGIPQLYALQPEAFKSTSTGTEWNSAEFEPDAWGMLAPKARVPVRPSNVAVVLVPGLAFDQHGHRLGRGAGIYDRLLAALPPNAMRIGFVFSDRVVPELPREPHDVRMDAVVTPDAILRPTNCA